MIFWPLIHTRFHNSLKIKPLQKPMWHRPDSSRNSGKFRIPLSPYSIVRDIRVNVKSRLIKLVLLPLWYGNKDIIRDTLS